MNCGNNQNPDEPWIEFEKPASRVHITEEEKVREVGLIVKMIEEVRQVVESFRRIIERKKATKHE